jgi:hypothetical protein
MAKRRNPVVRQATILRKGGPHATSVAGKRRRQKQAIIDEVELYFDENQQKHNGAASDCPDDPRLTARCLLAA